MERIGTTADGAAIIVITEAEVSVIAKAIEHTADLIAVTQMAKPKKVTPAPDAEPVTRPAKAPTQAKRTCEICGKPMTGSPLKKACSKACLAEKARRCYAASKAKKHTKAPPALRTPPTAPGVTPEDRVALLRKINARLDDPVREVERAAAREASASGE